MYLLLIYHWVNKFVGYLLMVCHWVHIFVDWFLWAGPYWFLVGGLLRWVAHRSTLFWYLDSSRFRVARVTPCSQLVQDLLLAKRELKIANLLKKLSRYDAVIIDDIGYVQQSREEMEVLFTFLADRYERSSIMITSNLPFSKWEQIFKDPMTTAAAIDRLVHHSVVLELNLSSYRLEQSKKGKNKKE